MDAVGSQSAWPGAESVPGILRDPLELWTLAGPGSAQDRCLPHRCAQEK